MTRLSALRVIDPPAWAATVRLALVEHRSVPLAAVALGVSRATLREWLRGAPGIAAGIALRGAGRPRDGRCEAMATRVKSGESVASVAESLGITRSAVYDAVKRTKNVGV